MGKHAFVKFFINVCLSFLEKSVQKNLLEFLGLLLEKSIILRRITCVINL